VSVASEAQAALGVPPDRLILQLREIARVSQPTHSLSASTLRWLHRDESIGVVDKPAGVLSVDGNDSALGPSVHRQVRERFPDARMVHRLDLETSGLLVIALTRGAAQHLNKQFRDRTVSKTYYARVVGRVAWVETQRRLRLPMERDPERKLLQRVVTDRDVPDDSALWSVTDVTVVDAGDESTLVELRPETGKTHQLRVHMLHIGHPILGDSLYEPARVKSLAPRLCLHAARLRFTHPDSGESLEFESACPF
jgi:tRNA pseudouridine32 synthase/23S rRNA pseudouridine746 synthase